MGRLGACKIELLRQSAGEDAWDSIRLPLEPPLNQAGYYRPAPILLAEGARRLYLVAESFEDNKTTSVLLGSADQGRTWQVNKNICTRDLFYSFPESASASPNGHITLLCKSAESGPTHAGYRQGVTTSADAGKSFGAAYDVPLVSDPANPVTAELVASPSPEMVAVRNTDGTVQISGNEGRSWGTSLKLATEESQRILQSVTRLGRGFSFTDEFNGHAIGPSDTIWTTSNSGRSWKPALLPNR